MAAIFCSLSPVLQQIQVQELWVEAQQDSESEDLLNLLNAQAHAMARTGACKQSQHEVPLAAHLGGRLALFYQGALVHALASMTTDLYEMIVQGSTDTATQRPAAIWCGRIVTELISTASLSTRVLPRAFSHRQLARQPPPIDVNLECYYCGAVYPRLQLHVYGACPSYFLLQFVQFVLCIMSSNLPLRGDFLDSQVYIPIAGSYALRYVQDSQTPTPAAQETLPPRAQETLPEVTLTHTGLIHISAGYATPRSVRELVPSVVQGLVEAIPTVDHALQQWRQLGPEVRPVANVPCSAVIRVRPGPPLSFEHSFVLSWVLRPLAVWHLHIRGTLTFPPPPSLPT